MAQKAKKDRAKSNAAALNNLHIGSAIVNVSFLLFHFLIKSRSLFWFILLSAPALICEFVLENAGRPKYDAGGGLKASGEDLAAAGLTEYMFDVVWVTWASVVLVILFGNWGWLLWLAVPAYGAYAGVGLLGAGKRMAQGMQGAGNNEAPVPANRKQRRAA
ncbi:SRP-independent targeting protein 2-like protein [Colletotrichum sp. SAR 10_99]|nr:SRP-independent targeting protein 2-like protein [Colletotrichum sp. SAR 10_96]KAI8280460.1 SRP-independent targeting protein 2-like protein [Colletotrichum sp. SAR 10_98]KAJ5013965.1 SRP-independent targeting protein 2-like protein [Colletotrichum sp. SAR 10_99]